LSVLRSARLPETFFPEDAAPPRRYNPTMRVLPAILLLALAASAAEPVPFPLWDGQESIGEYARKVNLPATQTPDLGNGIKLGLVLVPAGKFVMGTPEPTPVDEDGYRKKIVTGQAVLAAGVGVLLVLVGTVVIRAVRRRRRPQYSLARFVAMIVVAGVGVLGGTHWGESVRLLAEAKNEYELALARFEGADDWEKPAHEVTLTRPYYMGKFEVTQEQYQQVIARNPNEPKGPGLPVNVSWISAQRFCAKLGEKPGLAARLPSEAEWEHACRAGTKTTYYTGDSEADLDRAGWHLGNDDAMHPVGLKVPNAWGLYDMHGNVFEWCADWYEVYGGRRVLRGGSWCNDAAACRSASHGFGEPHIADCYIGFRVLVEVPQKP
jgi:formylglycine-generating enzyme required for sulfatase activity